MATHTIAQASTLVLKIYICVNQKGTSEGRLRQQGAREGGSHQQSASVNKN